MRFPRVALPFFAILFACHPWSSFAQFVLVREGRAEVEIVVPDALLDATRTPLARFANEPRAAVSAALELADAVEKMTGACLPIRGESSAGFGGRIYVGDCVANRELSAGLKPEEFLIRATEGALHIVGGDTTPQGMETQGTLFGVYDLLERECGVRWLFPGELGEVMPRRTTLEVPVLARRGQPRIAKRKIRNQAVTREAIFAPVLAGWGVPVEAWKTALGPVATGPWFRRQRLGARMEIEGGHSFAGYYEKYRHEHPDFFALQPDGTRQQRPERERLCKSNPRLWDFVARLRIEELKANPARVAISIAPNDGGQNKWCMCPGCRALDPAEAPRLRHDRGLIDPATGQPFADYPALSDRVFTFFNEVARRVRAEVPDRYLVCYAYSVYRTPPVRLAKLEPNLIVGYVGLDLAAIESWSKIAPQLVIRPNDLGPAIDLGLPRNHAAHLAHAVKFSVEHHAIGFDFDNCHGNWAAHGLDYYVLARALWDPGLDVRAVVADFCRAAYGPGAEAMQHYYDGLEKISASVRADDPLAARRGEPVRLLRHYTPEAIEEMAAQLAAARRAIGSQDSAALARVALVADAVEYTHRVSRLLRIAKQPKSAEYARCLADVEEFLKSKVLTLSLASLHSRRYLQMALRHSQTEVE